MRRVPRRSGFRRALVGAVALYALLLQALLAAATPTVGAERMDVICSPEGGSGPSSPETPARHDLQCCTAVVAADAVVPPAPAFVAAWTSPRSVDVARRPEASIPKTGPPTRSQSARGPPSA